MFPLYYKNRELCEIPYLKESMALSATGSNTADKGQRLFQAAFYLIIIKSSGGTYYIWLSFI